MDEYITKADARAVLHILADKMDDSGFTAVSQGISAINDMYPAIVRCKDCRHRDPEDKKCDCGEPERAGCSFPVSDDYFCPYGEK